MPTLEQINREIERLKNRNLMIASNQKYGQEKFKAQKTLFLLKVKSKLAPVVNPLVTSGKLIKSASINLQNKINKAAPRFSEDKLRKVLGV